MGVDAESAAADAPQQFHQGLELIGPIIFTYGSAAMKAKYLPSILSGDDWWCQGYSEPGAGSDLAKAHHLQRRPGIQQSHQPHDAAIDRKRPQRDRGQAQPPLSAGDPGVAGERQVQSRTDCHTWDSRDHRGPGSCN